MMDQSGSCEFSVNCFSLFPRRIEVQQKYSTCTLLFLEVACFQVHMGVGVLRIEVIVYSRFFYYNTYIKLSLGMKFARPDIQLNKYPVVWNRIFNFIILRKRESLRLVLLCRRKLRDCEYWASLEIILSLESVGKNISS